MSNDDVCYIMCNNERLSRELADERGAFIFVAHKPFRVLFYLPKEYVWQSGYNWYMMSPRGESTEQEFWLFVYDTLKSGKRCKSNLILNWLRKIWSWLMGSWLPPHKLMSMQEFNNVESIFNEESWHV